MSNTERLSAASQIFASFAAVILVGTAVAKLISCIVHPELGLELDFVFNFLTVRQVLAITALLELAVAGLCIIPRKHGYFTWLSLFWLSSCFLLYRLGPVIIVGHTKSPCRCLGSLSVSSGSFVENALLVTLALMLSGSLLLAVAETGRRYISGAIST